MISEWTKWNQFPDPRKLEYLSAPFGAGVYELRNATTLELVIVGESKNLAFRMSSLLPGELGAGARDADDKQDYVLKNLPHIEYRTVACTSKEEAVREQNKLKSQNKYLFHR